MKYNGKFLGLLCVTALATTLVNPIVASANELSESHSTVSSQSGSIISDTKSIQDSSINQSNSTNTNKEQETKINSVKTHQNGKFYN